MSLNDEAWETLFEKYNILDKIEKDGFYEIDSKTIKTVREPRLMAKFDHKINLPSIFRKHNLSILPISRSRYVLGKFNAYSKLQYDTKLKPLEVSLPENIQTIDRNNLYSESIALNCAYASGMINDLLEEEFVPTVSGRMGSNTFHFDINMNVPEVKTFNIQVRNAQLEIDAGFESENYFILIEAKNEAVNDFLIRQLYYPYRLWTSKITKPVIPVFFTLSNDIFSFFLFEFEVTEHYNSLKLVKQKNYILAHEEITLDDILEMLRNTKVVEEPTNAPFPQADSFKRVVDFLSILVDNDGEIDRETLGMTTTFNVVVNRQLDYYTSAAVYLGLVERKRINNKSIYVLTKKGFDIMKRPYKQKYLGLAQSILEHRIFKRVLTAQLENAGIPISKEKIVEMMKEENLYRVHSEETFWRRASTVQAWVDWILSLQEV